MPSSQICFDAKKMHFSLLKLTYCSIIGDFISLKDRPCLSLFDLSVIAWTSASMGMYLVTRARNASLNDYFLHGRTGQQRRTSLSVGDTTRGPSSHYFTPCSTQNLGVIWTNAWGARNAVYRQDTQLFRDNLPLSPILEKHSGLILPIQGISRSSLLYLKIFRYVIRRRNMLPGSWPRILGYWKKYAPRLSTPSVSLGPSFCMYRCISTCREVIIRVIKAMPQTCHSTL